MRLSMMTISRRCALVHDTFAVCLSSSCTRRLPIVLLRCMKGAMSSALHLPAYFWAKKSIPKDAIIDQEQSTHT